MKLDICTYSKFKQQQLMYTTCEAEKKCSNILASVLLLHDFRNLHAVTYKIFIQD